LRRPAGDGSNLDAHHDLFSVVGAHAVEFSKTVVAAPREGFSREETRPAQRPETHSGRPKSIALLRRVVRRA
jgi:hypothetical protein